MSADETPRSGRQDLVRLGELGVSNPDEFAVLPSQVVEQILARFAADESASVGALVFRLRQAVKAAERGAAGSRGDSIDRNREYGQQIVEWLTLNMPDLCDSQHGPHPAAVAEVIRLHHVHGKGTLTVARNGTRIRLAVKAWDRKWGIPETDGGSVAA